MRCAIRCFARAAAIFADRAANAVAPVREAVEANGVDRPIQRDLDVAMRCRSRKGDNLSPVGLAEMVARYPGPQGEVQRGLPLREPRMQRVPVTSPVLSGDKFEGLSMADRRSFGLQSLPERLGLSFDGLER